MPFPGSEQYGGSYRCHRRDESILVGTWEGEGWTHLHMRKTGSGKRKKILLDTVNSVLFKYRVQQ